MLVGSVGEHAGAQSHSGAVRRREVACSDRAQWCFVDRARLALEIVWIYPLLEMMVKTDLEPWHVVLRESVIPSFRDHEVEHRKPLRSEERRLQGSEPPQHLPLRLRQTRELRDQRGQPGAGCEDQAPGLVDAAVRGDAHSIAHRFPAEYSLSGPDVRACGQGALDVGADAALRQEEAATRLQERQVLGR